MSATAQVTDCRVHIRRSHSTTHPAKPVPARPPKKLAAMFGKRRGLARGRHLFLCGEPLRHVYMVVSGSFKVYATSLDGDEQVLGFFLPGDALGLEAVSSQSHVYSAIALEDAAVGELSLERLLGERDESGRRDGQELLQRLCFETIAKNYVTLRSRSTKFAEQRLCSFLIGLWDRIDADAQCCGALSLTMSRRDIGDYLGLALETVSRTFSQLEQQKLLSVQRRSVRMIDPDALRRIAGSVRSTSAENE